MSTVTDTSHAPPGLPDLIDLVVDDVVVVEGATIERTPEDRLWFAGPTGLPVTVTAVELAAARRMTARWWERSATAGERRYYRVEAAKLDVLAARLGAGERWADLPRRQWVDLAARSRDDRGAA